MTDFRFDEHTSDSGRESGRGRDSLAEMAEQIRLLDEAARQAAIRVGDAAEGLRQAPGDDFHTRLLGDLGSSLADRVNEIHAECERLSGMLARASRLSSRNEVPEIFRPAHLNGSAPNGSAPAEPVREATPEQPPAPRLDRRRAPGQATPEGVRLAATQMAVAGSSRTEIERCLRIQFGVDDADAALDEIFGTRPSEVR